MSPRVLLTLVALGVTGCLPYVVASSAKPTPVGEFQAVAPVYLIPDAFKIDSAHRTPAIGADLEARFGVSRRSDIGVRVPTLSGVVLTYKHLVTDPARRFGVALMPGVGYLVGYGYGDLTAIASGPLGRFEGYGGVRVFATTPLCDSLTRHGAVFGAFLGLKVPSRDREVLPEIGIFRGPPGLGSTRPRWNVVLSISVTGFGPVPRRRPRGWPPAPPVRVGGYEAFSRIIENR